jgi:hypothetical protein
MRCLKTIILILALCAASAAQLRVIQSRSGAAPSAGFAEVSGRKATKSFSGDSTTQAFAASVTSGDLSIVTGSCWTSGTATASIGVTDSLSTSYTVLSGVHAQVRAFIAYGKFTSSGANTVTVNPAGASSDCAFSIDAFSGNHATTLLDADGGCTAPAASSDTTISDSVTTVAANALVIGVASFDDTETTITPNGSYTEIGESETATSSQPFNAVYRVVTTATSYTVDWTFGASRSQRIACTASFNPA